MAVARKIGLRAATALLIALGTLAAADPNDPANVPNPDGAAGAVVRPEDAQNCMHAETPGKRAETCGAILATPNLPPKTAAWAHFWRGAALLALRNNPSAKSDFDEATHLDPDFAPAHWMRAVMLYQGGNPGDAYTELTELVRLAPKFAPGYGLRGDTRMAVGKFEAAASDYSRAIELGGDDKALSRYYQRRGEARGSLHQNELALADYDRAVTLSSSNVAVLAARASLYEDMHQYEKAIPDRTELIQRFPAVAFGYNRRAHLLDYLGRHQEAVEDYTKAIGMSKPPELAELYNDRGVAYWGDGQFPAALSDFDEAISRGGSFEAIRNRGMVKLFASDVPGAIADFSRAADEQPLNQYAPLWLFIAQTEAKQDAKAELRRRSAKFDLTQWPGPLVRVYLGDLSPDEVKLPGHDKDWETARDKCEMEYFLGEFHRLRGEPQPAAKSFRAAIDTGITEYIEFSAAGFELKRLAP